MASDNETIQYIVRELRSEPLAENGAKPWLHYLADRIEAAHKREIARSTSLLRTAGELCAGLMNKMNAQHAEIARLRKIVKELADALNIAREARPDLVIIDDPHDLGSAREVPK